MRAGDLAFFVWWPVFRMRGTRKLLCHAMEPAFFSSIAWCAWGGEVGLGPRERTIVALKCSQRVRFQVPAGCQRSNAGNGRGDPVQCCPGTGQQFFVREPGRVFQTGNVFYLLLFGNYSTPVRGDGHQPIIFLQCGPIRHRANKAENAPTKLEVMPNFLPAPEIPLNVPIQEVFRILMGDIQRNRWIAADAMAAYPEGRKVLVLAERTEHLQSLRDALGDEVVHCFMLHGRLTKKERAATLAELAALDGALPRVLLNTGRLIGEGFDHPPLDTLVLAIPISWKGTLQQYAGRLHREHDGKQNVRILDYIERDQPQLARMWDKRQRGYRAMGYEIVEHPASAG